MRLTETEHAMGELLLAQIQEGDTVSIRNPKGRGTPVKGKAILKSAADGWVLEVKLKTHTTHAKATAENVFLVERPNKK